MFDIYVKSNEIYYNQGYMLNIQYNDGSSWSDLDNYLLYFSVPGSSSTSGDLLNPDFNSDIDLSVIQAFNSLFPSDDISNQQLQEIAGSFFSGDVISSISGDLFLSGDSFFGVTFNDYDDWGFGDLVKWFYNGIYATLTSYQDVFIDFGFLGTMSSSAFNINNQVINNFLSVFSGAFLLIILIFFYWRFIIKLSTLDLNGLLKYNADNMFHLF